MQRISWCPVVVVIALLTVRAIAVTNDLRGAVFRGAYGTPAIKIVSDDELEFTPDKEGPNLIGKYSRQGDSLRVVVTVLGSPQAIYFKFVSEGLQQRDGTTLYDATHFDEASKAAAERERQKAAALASLHPPSPSPTAGSMAVASAKSLAIFAPRPEYPAEASSRHITGSGVVALTVDTTTGVVTDASMTQSIGSPILDNAALSAFRRWRFKPGTISKVKIPITFTITGASY